MGVPHVDSYSDRTDRKMSSQEAARTFEAQQALIASKLFEGRRTIRAILGAERFQRLMSDGGEAT